MKSLRYLRISSSSLGHNTAAAKSMMAQQISTGRAGPGLPETLGGKQTLVVEVCRLIYIYEHTFPSDSWSRGVRISRRSGIGLKIRVGLRVSVG